MIEDLERKKLMNVQQQSFNIERIIMMALSLIYWNAMTGIQSKI